MPDVENRMKPDGYGLCECDEMLCTLRDMGNYRLGKPDKLGRRHARGCVCPSCRGRRNRRKGDEKAAKARKVLAIGGVNSRHEELFGGSLRIEVKAGAQIGPAVRAFKKCEGQSEAARSIGDVRPFAAVWMPDGSSDGVLACNLSDAYDVAVAILENRVGAS